MRRNEERVQLSLVKCQHVCFTGRSVLTLALRYMFLWIIFRYIFFTGRLQRFLNPSSSPSVPSRISLPMSSDSSINTILSKNWAWNPSVCLIRLSIPSNDLFNSPIVVLYAPLSYLPPSSTAAATAWQRLSTSSSSSTSHCSYYPLFWFPMIQCRYNSMSCYTNRCPSSSFVSFLTGDRYSLFLFLTKLCDFSSGGRAIV